MNVRSFFFMVLFFGVLSCNVEKKTTLALEEGISLELANYRKQQVDSVVYNLSFKIPLEREKAITATLNLSLDIANLEHPLFLDFNEKKEKISSISVNGTSIPVKHEKEHVIVLQKYLKLGQNYINILFNAGELSLNRNPDFLYTLLVPDRASTLFPCFDQPNIKAHYKLKITAPKTWRVLCGSPLLEKKESNNYISYDYEMSDKMSTYLFSFVAGEFQKITSTQDAMSMTFLYRENNEEKKKASINKIFSLHNESIKFLEDYTQYKFPFKKLDFASIPGFQYGGMEHVGAIQYKASTLFLDNYGYSKSKIRKRKTYSA